MADYFRFSCPKCGQRLKAKREAVGRPAHCERCDTPLDIPDPARLKDDPATPRTAEASLAAAETDPASMVLKDQTSANYDVARPRRTMPTMTTAHKGCGRALGIAGLIVVVGGGVIGVAAYGIGEKGSSPHEVQALPGAPRGGGMPSGRQGIDTASSRLEFSPSRLK